MQRTLDAILKRLIVEGEFAVRWPDATRTVYVGRPGPHAEVAIKDNRTIRRIILNPSLAVGEAYMDGTLVPLGCSLFELLDLLIANAMAAGGGTRIMRWRARLGQPFRRLAQHNPASRARRNAAHHYDLNSRLYSLFLDRDRQYSCGYFPSGNETIDEAQEAKKRHIAAKLLLDRPDLSVLDIGSGWGGLALTLAEDYGARVFGITLSSEQLTESRARAAAAGLADRVRFELLDYRALDQRFDRIVSVGMFEHVGVGYYPAFFTALKRCLAPDGVALLHAISRSDGPGATNPWIAKYIFPGGYTPALSEVLPVIERAGLWATDIEVLRLHYAKTLACWRQRFLANRDTILALTDERFCRMWEFYLVGSELAFRREGQMVFQIQIARSVDAVPMTRNYMIEDEARATRLHAARTNA
ncbi:MAG: class I SAM-dependent methyltransferase [Acetobacteraceae bacterium]